MDLRHHYKAVRTLVTGGCSFIGSHLAERLVALGAKVTIVDDLSSGSLENIASIRDRITFIEGDLRNFEVAREATAKQSLVFHLASIHGGRGFIETHPADVSQSMVIDGSIYRACSLSGVKHICYASSACVYPTNLQMPGSASFVRFLEEDMADPFRPGCALADKEYGWGKLMGEMVLKAFHAQYKIKGVCCRLFTAYGPRENESHAVIALIARALMRQDPFVIWGSGNQERNFTFVDDVVEGCLRSAVCIEDGSAINIGTDEVVSVFSAAKTICSSVGHHPSEYAFDTSMPQGPIARAASVALQRKILHWSPTVSFETGIRSTIDWYRSNRSQGLAKLSSEPSAWLER
jgi:nucleoside-diphosphate-sugar epimerase